ncbi:flavin reductase family protein [Pseudarthrobacter sp. H3Y2-7]|uniref:flavin reductase family protein n=1 Tax=Pseudarthrobacter naphthalenicus TaxID=3031328 RepID=UPI0023AF320B|nr:flavin reductase family protein [Pseudarthrobacter sp. H3Y2-7]MDE8670616.1 flavin reductase family protein [Pseudarthrobacter sp. H3Y2-7]
MIKTTPPSTMGLSSAGSVAGNVYTGSDTDAFRSAMRRVVSGVTVVTTLHDGRPWGMTVNAFSSVCAEPPTILVCVNNRTVTASDIAKDGRFAANLLTQDQLHLSGLCARPGAVKYLDGYTVATPEFSEQVTMPVLRDSLVTFDCKVSEVRPVGSHFVVIAAVEAIVVPSARTPLLYGEGRYMHGVTLEESPAMLTALAWA